MIAPTGGRRAGKARQPVRGSPFPIKRRSPRAPHPRKWLRVRLRRRKLRSAPSRLCPPARSAAPPPSAGASLAPSGQFPSALRWLRREAFVSPGPVTPQMKGPSFGIHGIYPGDGRGTLPCHSGEAHRVAPGIRPPSFAGTPPSARRGGPRQPLPGRGSVPAGADGIRPGMTGGHPGSSPGQADPQSAEKPAPEQQSGAGAFQVCFLPFFAG